MSGIVRLHDSGNFPELVAAVHDALSNVETVDDARNVVEGLDDARKVLDAMHQYHKVASEFCVLELMAYFKLLDIFREDPEWNADEEYWFSGVTAAERHRLEYLDCFGEEERQTLIDRCRYEGMSIDSLYRECQRELREERKTRERAEDAERIASYCDRTLEHFNDHLVANISVEDALRGCHDKSSFENRQLASGVVERTRDALLKHGGFGTGNGRYVMLNDCDDVRKALKLRLTSIMHDVRSVLSICEEWGIDVDECGNFTFKDTNPLSTMSTRNYDLLRTLLRYCKKNLIEGEAA